MRDYWTDFRGKAWPLTTMKGRLKFKLPSHAAMRAHVFHCDGFTCRRCLAKAVNVPLNYDGRYTLNTNTKDRCGWTDILVLDHILTLKAGGLNRIENLQTLCEVCNKKKQLEDKAATAAYLRRGLL